MRHLYALAVVSGCIYAEPINQRPSLDIERKDPGEVFRGDTVKLHAIANDPEFQYVHFQWRAYLCTTASLTLEQCDKAPFYADIREDAQFDIPLKRVDEDLAVEQIFVLLEGQDSYGATANPIQQLVIPVSNHAPGLELRKDSRYGYVVDVPMNVYAKVDDADDNPDEVEISWKVYTPPNQPSYTFVDAMMPGARQFAKTFKPGGVGDWEIEVTATDASGRACIAEGGSDCKMTIRRVMISVVADHAPCLSQWAPIAPPVGAQFPLTEPTLFQVTVVQDDLDPFPGFPNDPVLDTTEFTWSLLPPGASTRQALGVDSSRVSLDPGNYSPGDVLELRVEIADRNNTPVNCADASPTCSVISDNSCLQRLTWRVEVR